MQVDIKMPPSAKTEEQNGYFENLVGQGYNGIRCQRNPAQRSDRSDQQGCEENQCDHVRLGRAKSNRMLYIGTNNFKAGKTLGAEIMKLLPNGGKMAVFVGTFAADNAAQRWPASRLQSRGTTSRSSQRKRMQRTRPRHARMSKT